MTIAGPRLAPRRRTSLAARRGIAVGLVSALALAGSLAAGKLTDSTYTTIAAHEFDMVTPENEMKIDATEPRLGHFNFTIGDKVYDWATKHGKRVHGNTLAWHSAMPAYTAGMNAATLRKWMIDHITGVMTHDKGKIYS